MKKKTKKRKLQYCKEHDQEYETYLHECPICVGVRFGQMHDKGLDYNLRHTAIIRRKK